MEVEPEQEPRRAPEPELVLVPGRAPELVLVLVPVLVREPRPSRGAAP